MNDKKKISVLIAIQARSTSKRFPQKIFQLIGKKSVLEHVIDQSKSAKIYLERSSHKYDIQVEVAILYPEFDNQIETSFRHLKCIMVKGDEENVLSRFIKAYEVLKPDYIVRLTSDCPLILDFMISKHINCAVFNDLDYISNVDEECRTVADGLDVEVMSKKAIGWLIENASTKEELEHVTLAIRKKQPKELEIGFITSKHDSSDMKLSLDTKADLENIRTHYHNREFKKQLAQKKFGKKNIYEI